MTTEHEPPATNGQGAQETNGQEAPVTNDQGPAEVSTGVASPGRDGPDVTRERLDAFDRRLAAVEAELDAVRGLLDGVDAVDESIERRASIALAKVEALERRLDDGERGLVRERIPGTGSPESPGNADDAASPEAVEGGSRSGCVPDGCDGPGPAAGSTRAHGGDAGPASDHDRSRAADAWSESDTAKPQADPSESDGSLASRLRDAFR